MRILFVRPKHTDLMLDSRFFSKIKLIRKPMTFPILTALTPEKHSVELVEGVFKDINFDKKYDLVGITCITCFASLVYEIADEFRRRGVPVVLGGYHPTALPHEAKQHADAVVIDEAEETWPKLLNDLEKNQLKPFYFPDKPVDSNIMPSPLNLYKKNKGIGIQATRGCPNKCEFCSITNMEFKNVYRMRPIEIVFDEIQTITEKRFVFQDSCLTVNPEYTKQLFREIKDLNKKFLAFGTINILGRDKELLKLASDAGCIGWVVGFESLCQQSLDNIAKRTNTANEYLSSVKKIHDHGMIIEGSFVFGFDYDTVKIFAQTDDFIRKSEIDVPFALFLVPFPGTPIFERFDREGRILTKDWSKYSGREVVFQPKNMSPEELFMHTYDLNKIWHHKSISIRRILKSLNLGLYPFIESFGSEIDYKLLKFTNFVNKQS